MTACDRPQIRPIVAERIVGSRRELARSDDGSLLGDHVVFPARLELVGGGQARGDFFKTDGPLLHLDDARIVLERLRRRRGIAELCRGS